jgi:DnaJ-domain-containing protein 1
MLTPMSSNDAYRILEISEGASPDEIKNAYRIMVVIHQRPWLLEDVFIAL